MIHAVTIKSDLLFFVTNVNKQTSQWIRCSIVLTLGISFNSG